MAPSRLWARLAGEEARVDVLAGWQRAFGDELPVLRPYLVETAATSSSWSCGHGREGCAREVVRYDDEVAAVCRAPFARCARVTISIAELALWRLDVERIAAAIVRTLGLERNVPGPVAPSGRAFCLGRQRLAGRDLRFYLVGRSNRDAYGDLARTDRALGEGLAILLCATPAPADLAVHAREQGVILVALPDHATPTQAGLLVNLDEVYHGLRNELVGLDPSTVFSRRKRLIVDYAGSRVWLDHQRVDIPPRAHLPFRLLVALARRPGALVTRRRLYPELWENGWDPRSHEQYARLIRPHRTALGKLAAFPISATAGDEDRGGWTLDLAPEEVVLWTEPVPFQPPTQQRKPRK